MGTTSKISKSSRNQERQWKIESAMSTINRYNELVSDRSLMRDVQKKAQEQLKTVQKLGGVTPKRK